MITQRDAFLDDLFFKAKSDKDIILISVDMGAPSIDKWRRQLSAQFFDLGISEQNAINFASGLARGGKKVFVYFMAVWVMRCFEQIRYSSVIANNKITILGNGVGLGYAPAGPAHETSEDVGVMKTLHGINIWSPSSSESIPYIVNECMNSSVTNYVRLERKSHSLVSYSPDSVNNNQLITKFKCDNEKGVLTILTYGFVAGVALEAGKRISKDSDTTVNVVDLQKIWPLPETLILELAEKSNGMIVLEEQSPNGGISESVSSILIRCKKLVNFNNISLPSKYIFENGTREQLLENYGLSVKDVVRLSLDAMVTN